MVKLKNTSQRNQNFSSHACHSYGSCKYDNYFHGQVKGDGDADAAAEGRGHWSVKVQVARDSAVELVQVADEKLMLCAGAG